MNKRFPYPDPNTGQVREYEGAPISVLESREKFTVVRLGDGAVLRMKLQIQGAYRLADVWDADGNPIYVIESNNALYYNEIPPDLRRPT